MTLLLVLVLAPWDAMTAPALIIIVRAPSILQTEKYPPLDRDRSYITKDEDPCVPFGSNARELGSVDDDASKFSPKASFLMNVRTHICFRVRYIPPAMKAGATVKQMI